MEKKTKDEFSMPDIREWLTVLDNLRQENIALKYRLSEAVRQSISRPFIETAEIFQQKSVDKDQLIDLLRHDIANLLIKMKFNDVVDNDAAVLQQQARTLETDVQKVVSGFEQMKQAFDQYLTGYDAPGSK